MDDNLKLWFSYISQIREQDIKTRIHGVSLLVIALGAIAWLLFTETWLTQWMKVILILILLIFIGSILIMNKNLSQCDVVYDDLLTGILTRRLSDDRQIAVEFAAKVNKARGLTKRSMERALDAFEGH